MIEFAFIDLKKTLSGHVATYKNYGFILKY